MEENEPAKAREEPLLDSQDRAPTARAASPADQGSSKQAVVDWLASSEPGMHQQADAAAAQTAAAAARPEPQGPVAALVQQFEHMTTSGPPANHGHGLASLMDRSLFVPSTQHPQQSSLAKKAHLTPLQIPGVAASGEQNPQASLGAAARNEAAMAAHRARLHPGKERKDQWAHASRRSVARTGVSQARHGLDVQVEPSRLTWEAAAAQISHTAPLSPDEADASLAPERSSISAAWARINPVSGRPPIRRFGSVGIPGSQPLSPALRPAAVTIAEIMRQASVATPNGVDPSWPSSPRRQPSAVTVAQIMRQNTHLKPLDFVPPSPSIRADAPRTPGRDRVSFAVSPDSLNTSGSQSSANFWAHALDRGRSLATSGPARSRSGSPDYWSDPGAGSPGVTPKGRVRLPPLSTAPSGMLQSSPLVKQQSEAANK